MIYALLGKIFASLVIFVIVWTLTVLFTKTDDGVDGWGRGMASFFFLGPFLGIVAAVIGWLYVLPPLP